MSNAVHDLARVSVIVDDQRIPGSSDGDFLTLDVYASYTLEAAMGDGQSVASRMNGRDVPGSFTVGPYSEAHRVLGVLYRKQEALANAKVAHQGFLAAYRNPANGDTVLSEAFMILQGPQIVEANGVSMRQWQVAFRSSTVDYGSAIPVGGGSL